MNHIGKNVVVKWIDSAGTEGWTPKEVVLAMQPVEITTLGRVVRQDDKSLLIVSTDGGDSCDGAFCIPARAIVSVRRLK